MPKQSKPNRVITPDPFWVLVKKRTGEIYPCTLHEEAREHGWPGLYGTREKAKARQELLEPGWMIRKVVPRLEVLDHA